MTSASRSNSLSRSPCPAAPWLRRGSPLLAPAADASAEEPWSRLPASCQPCQLQPSAAGTPRGRDPAHVPAVPVTATPVPAVGTRQQRCQRHKPPQGAHHKALLLRPPCKSIFRQAERTHFPLERGRWTFLLLLFFLFFPTRQYPHPLFPKNG